VAAGNDGAGPIFSAPASEPFVITVGATDVVETATTADDTNAPWSSYGRTTDGVPKPEVAAPGRYMAGPIARTGTLDERFPHRVVAPGYMWMSGTSFAAPVVAGAAAQILAMNSSFKPDQVKGALIATARDLPLAVSGSVGFGQIDVAAAAELTTPPNANAPLNQFLKSDSRVPGGRVFDYPCWAAVAESDPDWFTASWSDASWSDEAWADVSWSDASWSDDAWSEASWSDASWSDASWADASWADASWAD
jgi:serine protease AprX